MMDAQDIGAILRAAREAKGISIASAAMQTRLSIDILEKLEANRFSEIAAPVFTRGYLMHYSRFLGLDADVMAADFNRLGFKDSEIRLSSANIASQSHSFKRYHFGTWLSIVPLIALAGVVLTQVFNPNSWLISQFKQAFDKERAPLVENTGSSDTQITLQIAADNGATITQPVENSFEEMPSLTSLPAQTLPSSSTSETLSLSAIDNSGAEDIATSTVSPVQSNASEDTSIAVSEAEKNSQDNVLTQAAQPSLQLRVSSENWVEVRDKEHRIVTSKVYQAGDSIDIPLGNGPYEFNIGRPDAASLIINGQAADLMQYRVGKSRRFKVTINE